MKIYLAAAYQRQLEMRAVAIVLTSWGHTVTSRWIGDDQETTPLGGFGVDAIRHYLPEARAAAVRDCVDMAHAELVISFTDGQPARGGRHVEFGMAYAWEKRLIVVGPREHVFHALADVEWYPDWETCARHMGTWCVDRASRAE